MSTFVLFLIFNRPDSTARCSGRSSRKAAARRVVGATGAGRSNAGSPEGRVEMDRGCSSSATAMTVATGNIYCGLRELIDMAFWTAA